MTWFENLRALNRGTGSPYDDFDAWVSKSRAYIQAANDELKARQIDEPEVRLEVARRNYHSKWIAEKLRQSGDIAGALKEISAIENYPLPDLCLFNFFSAQYQAALGNHEMAAQHRERYLAELKGQRPWDPVYQDAQRKKDVAEDFTLSIEHEKQKPDAKFELATAHFCYAVSLGRDKAATNKVMAEFQTAFALAINEPTMIAAAATVLEHVAKNQLPLKAGSPDLQPDKDYCCLWAEGIGDQRSGRVEYYGRTEQSHGEWITDFSTVRTQLLSEGWQAYASSASGRDQYVALYFVRPKPKTT